LKKAGLHNLPFSNEIIKQDLIEEEPASICQEGHRHLYGKHGRKKDYQLAAQYFSKAASMGNAEGVYNLAILTAEGNGVERNFKESHQLLLQAAEMPSSIEVVPGSGYEILNLGVREAQHSLGMRYQEGIHVPKSYKEVSFRND
jgi:TPR repeat protein